ncbi:MAG: translation initiation factor IF-1 [Patescibacteria group bacterium]|nr:translation initiation factor IF-1 [Patescibacteria group bacterium]
MKQATETGMVLEEKSSNLFLVKLEDGRELLAYLAGKMKFNHIRVLIGDTVEVVVDPYGGKATNRIVSRGDKKP